MSALRTAAARAVHLKVYPRPTSISDSRELLHVLQQFGEVAMFRHLWYDYVQPSPNTCLAIFRDAASAASLLRASPLRFTLEPPAAGDGGVGDRAGQPHEQNSQSARDGATASALHPDLDPDIADVIGDAEFALKEGRGKSGAEEMLRPSRLLFDRLDAFGESDPAAQLATAQDTASSDVSDGAQLKHSSADAAESVEQSGPDHAGEQQQQQPDPFAREPVSKPQTPRVFHVVADISEMNHRDYIERSYWYGPYVPRKKTYSYTDLTARGVSSNIADLVWRHPEQILRVVKKFRDANAGRPTMRQIWEQGQQQRAQESGSSSGPVPDEATRQPDFMD